MRDEIIACADLVRRGDPDRFLSVMAAPVAAREKLFPIYAFNVEVARAPWVTQEPMIAEMRLQWWRDALEEMRGDGPVRRHEVATPLSSVVDNEGARRLDALVAARRWDIYKEPFEDMDHFRSYLTATSAELLCVAARAFGDMPEHPVREAGYAMGIANWLRAVPRLEASGRIPLIDGTEKAMRALAEEGLDHLSAARAARRQILHAARPVMLALWQTNFTLKTVRKTPSRVAQGALDQGMLRSRLSLMARAASGIW